jgi:hypothetical protein
MRLRYALIGFALGGFAGIFTGVTISGVTSWNIFLLTEHQLDVLRSLGNTMAGIGGLGGGVAAVLSFLARKWAKRASDQTATTHYVNGEQRVIPVVEYAKHASMASEASRQETSDFRNEWVKGNGRRRLPTDTIPRLSTYIGDPNDE